MQEKTCLVEDREVIYGYVDDDGKFVPDLNKMLAILLLTDSVFLNNHWWEKDWPEAARAKTAICAVCSDVFAWGTADAEVINFNEIEAVFDHWLKDHEWGVAVWCIKKRGRVPQPPVYSAIQKGGIWDLDSLKLYGRTGLSSMA